LAATNCPWELDEAFRRRLEKRIYVGLPDKATRLILLKNCLCNVKLGEDVKLDELAAKTEGYSGADITNLCRDAALQPMRECLDNLEDYKAAGEQLSASFLEEKPIKMSHFNSAMKRVKSSCSPDTIKKYKEWERLFGAV
ncbi:UNVERIFIED_CONTAM: Katanin p60 ATPase-containing subunit A-like 1, partial [Eudyptes robustus]